MNLSQFENKKVKIITTDDIAYTGIAMDFTPADENTPGVDSICIGTNEFFEFDIKTIEVVKA